MGRPKGSTAAVVAARRRQAHIDAIVADAPALTDEQIDALRALLPQSKPVDNAGNGQDPGTDQ